MGRPELEERMLLPHSEADDRFAPDRLVHNVHQYLGDSGAAWLRRLPSLVHEFSDTWSLALGNPFPDLSFSYVVPATRADGERCVLKLGEPNLELSAGVQALRFWNGRGAVRLLEAAPDQGAMLLERIDPGTMLLSLSEEDDEAATRVVARLCQELWHRPPPAGNAIELASWFSSLLTFEQEPGEGAFPPTLLAHGQRVAEELLTSTGSPVLLHGDLHHFNVLHSDQRGWLAIDPKSLVGDAAFEVAGFLRNPVLLPASVVAPRLDIFAYDLGLDRSRILKWCVAEASLNACWSIEDDDGKLDEKLAWGELLANL
jgi:streptomycin 6-kinase